MGKCQSKRKQFQTSDIDELEEDYNNVIVNNGCSRKAQSKGSKVRIKHGDLKCIMKVEGVEVLIFKDAVNQCNKKKCKGMFRRKKKFRDTDYCNYDEDTSPFESDDSELHREKNIEHRQKDKKSFENEHLSRGVIKTESGFSEESKYVPSFVMEESELYGRSQAKFESVSETSVCKPDIDAVEERSSIEAHKDDKPVGATVHNETIDIGGVSNPIRIVDETTDEINVNTPSVTVPESTPAVLPSTENQTESYLDLGSLKFKKITLKRLKLSIKKKVNIRERKEKKKNCEVNANSKTTGVESPISFESSSSKLKFSSIVKENDSIENANKEMSGYQSHLKVETNLSGEQSLYELKCFENQTNIETDLATDLPTPDNMQDAGTHAKVVKQSTTDVDLDGGSADEFRTNKWMKSCSGYPNESLMTSKQLSSHLPSSTDVQLNSKSTGKGSVHIQEEHHNSTVMTQSCFTNQTNALEFDAKHANGFQTEIVISEGLFDGAQLVSQCDVECKLKDDWQITTRRSMTVVTVNNWVICWVANVFKQLDDLLHGLLISLERYYLTKREQDKKSLTNMITQPFKSDKETSTSGLQSQGSNSELKKPFNDLNAQILSVGALNRDNHIGTVFVVGKKYVMTAWHVVRDIIQDQFSNFNYSKLDQASNLNENPLQTTTHQCYVELEQAFVDAKLDVAVLEIKSPFNLLQSIESTLVPNISLCGFGQPGSSKKHMEHGCQIKKPNSTVVTADLAYLLTKQQNDEITWSNYFKIAFAEIGYEISLVDLEYSGYDNESKLHFHCFMEHGASGSPILTPKLRQGPLYAVSVLQIEMPEFLFILPKMVQTSFPDASFMLEMGAKMFHVHNDQLHVYSLPFADGRDEWHIDDTIAYNHKPSLVFIHSHDEFYRLNSAKITICFEMGFKSGSRFLKDHTLQRKEVSFLHKTYQEFLTELYISIEQTDIVKCTEMLTSFDDVLVFFPKDITSQGCELSGSMELLSMDVKSILVDRVNWPMTGLTLKYVINSCAHGVVQNSLPVLDNCCNFSSESLILCRNIIVCLVYDASNLNKKSKTECALMLQVRNVRNSVVHKADMSVTVHQLPVAVYIQTLVTMLFSLTNAAINPDKQNTKLMLEEEDFIEYVFGKELKIDVIQTPQMLYCISKILTSKVTAFLPRSTPKQHSVPLSKPAIPVIEVTDKSTDFEDTSDESGYSTCADNLSMVDTSTERRQHLGLEKKRLSETKYKQKKQNAGMEMLRCSDPDGGYIDINKDTISKNTHSLHIQTSCTEKEMNDHEKSDSDLTLASQNDEEESSNNIYKEVCSSSDFEGREEDTELDNKDKIDSSEIETTDMEKGEQDTKKKELKIGRTQKMQNYYGLNNSCEVNMKKIDGMIKIEKEKEKNTIKHVERKEFEDEAKNVPVDEAKFSQSTVPLNPADDTPFNCKQKEKVGDIDLEKESKVIETYIKDGKETHVYRILFQEENMDRNENDFEFELSCHVKENLEIGDMMADSTDVNIGKNTKHSDLPILQNTPESQNSPNKTKSSTSEKQAQKEKKKKKFTKRRERKFIDIPNDSSELAKLDLKRIQIECFKPSCIDNSYIKFKTVLKDNDIEKRKKNQQHRQRKRFCQFCHQTLDTVSMSCKYHENVCQPVHARAETDDLNDCVWHSIDEVRQELSTSLDSGIWSSFASSVSSYMSLHEYARNSIDKIKRLERTKKNRKSNQTEIKLEQNTLLNLYFKIGLIEHEIEQSSKTIRSWSHFKPRDVDIIVCPGLEGYFERLRNGPPPSLEEQMQYEWFRFSSFHYYNGNGSAIVLARNGFYHDSARGNSETRCFACGVRYSTWSEFDDVEAIHRKLSPNCPHVHGHDTESRNVSITQDEPRQEHMTATATNRNGNDDTATVTAALGGATGGPVEGSAQGATGGPLSMEARVQTITEQMKQAHMIQQVPGESLSLQPQEDANNVLFRSNPSALTQGETRAQVPAPGSALALPRISGLPRYASTHNNLAQGARTNVNIPTSTSGPPANTSTTAGSTGSLFSATLGGPARPGDFNVQNTSANTVIAPVTATAVTTQATATVTNTRSEDSNTQQASNTTPAGQFSTPSQPEQEPQPPATPGAAGGGRRPDEIVVSNPKHPDYASIDRRADSFNGWPTYLDQTARQMAEAGFFYAGVADFTRCYCCGGGLRNWEPGDDPVLEHTRWYPTCNYVNNLKGARYVQAVVRRQQQHMAERQRQQAALARRRDTQQLAPDPMNTPAAGVLREMGYSVERVKEAILAVREQTGHNTVSAQQALVWILDIDENGEETTNTRSRSISPTVPAASTRTLTPPTTTTTNQPTAPSQAPPTTTAPPSVSTSSIQSNESSTSTSAVAGSIQGAAAGSNEDTRKGSGSPSQNATGKKANRKKKKKPSSTTNSGPLVGATGTSELDTQSLKEENDKLREMQTCKICMERPVNITLLPCGHLVCCQECAPKLVKCPICRQRIKGTVKTFMS